MRGKGEEAERKKKGEEEKREGKKGDKGKGTTEEGG